MRKYYLGILGSRWYLMFNRNDENYVYQLVSENIKKTKKIKRLNTRTTC